MEKLERRQVPGQPGYAVVFDYDGTLIDSRQVKLRNYTDAVLGIFSPPEQRRGDIEQSCLRTMGANRFIQLADTLGVLGIEASEQQRQDWSGLYSELNGRTIQDTWGTSATTASMTSTFSTP